MGFKPGDQVRVLSTTGTLDMALDGKPALGKVLKQEPPHPGWHWVVVYRAAWAFAVHESNMELMGTEEPVEDTCL